ncbi:Snf7 family [Syncephalis fuscata]|nr:Snf7 family [Syncephalis fuscata]
MHLFGRARNKPNPQEAIVKLRETLQLLQKRETFCRQRSTMKSKLLGLMPPRTNEVTALMALKRKKKYEEQIEQTTGARMTLETQAMAIEGANINLEAINAMKVGAKAIRDIHGSMGIDEVDKTMDDIREQMDLANEISGAISQPLSFGTDLDEDELAAELEALEQEELDEKLLGAEVPPIFMPNTPQLNTAQEEDHDAELEKLRAEMAM